MLHLKNHVHVLTHDTLEDNMKIDSFHWNVLFNNKEVFVVRVITHDTLKDNSEIIELYNFIKYLLSTYSLMTLTRTKQNNLNALNLLRFI